MNGLEEFTKRQPGEADTRFYLDNWDQNYPRFTSLRSALVASREHGGEVCVPSGVELTDQEAKVLDLLEAGTITLDRAIQFARHFVGREF